MSTPRRSERLAPKLFVANMHQFTQVREQILRTAGCIMPSTPTCVSSETKIKMIVKVVKLANSNYDIIKQHGGENFAKFLNMLYKKSFGWIQETISLCVARAPPMVGVFKKFHKKHETSRYASWEFLRSQYRLDANIMFRIDSYM
jgi:hypothetical protein